MCVECISLVLSSEEKEEKVCKIKKKKTVFLPWYYA